MNTAILDLGTNTFNLLVRSAEGALVFSDKISVRLGAGGLRDGVITPEAADRAVAAVAQHLVSARAYGAARSLAFATSAMRSTANGADLADRIERETGDEWRPDAVFTGERMKVLKSAIVLANELPNSKLVTFTRHGFMAQGLALLVDTAEAGFAMPSAALNCMYLFRSPATPIEVRLSNTFSTSSGRLMFSM